MTSRSATPPPATEARRRVAPRTPARRRRGVLVLGLLTASLGPAGWPTAFVGRSARAADDAAAVQAKAKADAAVRAKWERAVQLYGQEATGLFSLRVLDKDATFEGRFAFKELWKFDVATRAWVRVSDKRQEAKLVPAARKPVEADPDSQQLAELPVRLQDVGLYYAKWTGDGVACATYARLGPRARQRTLKGKPPPGYRVEDVPIDVNHAEVMFVPSPQFFTGEGSEPVTEGKR